MPNLAVLYEDNHLLVINKPAPLATQGAAEGEESVVQRAKAYLKERYAKPGNVYLGVVSRLDALVTGVLVLARTSKSAARLNEQFAARSPEKVYWALVEGRPQRAAERLVQHLLKDDRAQRMVIVNPQAPGAQAAELSFRTLQALPTTTLLEIRLATGRKHQIRVQLADYGTPILGDGKYGAAVVSRVGIALHARRLAFRHPTLNTPLEFTAPLPPSWSKWGFSEQQAQELESP